MNCLITFNTSQRSVDLIAGCCVAQTPSRGLLGGSPKSEVKARLGEVRFVVRMRERMWRFS